MVAAVNEKLIVPELIRPQIYIGEAVARHVELPWAAETVADLLLGSDFLVHHSPGTLLQCMTMNRSVLALADEKIIGHAKVELHRGLTQWGTPLAEVGSVISKYPHLGGDMVLLATYLANRLFPRADIVAVVSAANEKSATFFGQTLGAEIFPQRPQNLGFKTQPDGKPLPAEKVLFRLNNLLYNLTDK